MNRTPARLVVLLTGDALVLLTVRPRWRYVGAGLARPRSWLAAAGPDVALAAVCATLLWLAAAWLAVGLLAGVGTRLPGATGRACGRLARVVVPTVLVRVVLGSTALGLLAAPAAAATARPVTPAATAAPVSAMLPVADGVSGPASFSPWTGLGVPSPTWPVTPSPSTPVNPPTWPATPSGTPTRLPAPAPPTSGTRAPVPTPSPPTTPTPTTPTPTTPAPSTADPTTADPTTHVHRGDSLWLLAARRLGAHADPGAVAHYWPKLYAANRGVIGDDPSVIHPGQVLHLPAPTQEPS